MAFCKNIPPHIQNVIKNISVNVLTYQKDGRLYLHDFYTGVNAYKTRPSTDSETYILSQAILEAQKLYLKETGGRLLEVVGTPITANQKNANTFKAANSSAKLKGIGEKAPEAKKTKPTPKKTTKQTQTQSQIESVVKDMEKAPWWSHMKTKLQDMNFSPVVKKEFVKFTNRYGPLNASAVFDVFRGKDVDGHQEGISELESVSDIADSLNAVASKQGDEKLEAEWSASTAQEREEEHNFTGESFFHKFGAINIFRQREDEPNMWNKLSDIASKNWTGKDKDSAYDSIRDGINAFQTKGLFDRFQIATTNYLMGNENNLNILFKMALPVDEYTDGDKKPSSPTDKKKRDTGTVYQLPSIITDTMLALLPNAIEDARRSKEELVKRQNNDGAGLDITDPTVMLPALNDVALDVGRKTLQALGLSYKIYTTNKDGKRVRDKKAEDKLVYTLGQVAILGMVDLGLAEIDSLKEKGEDGTFVEMRVVKLKTDTKEKHNDMMGQIEDEVFTPGLVQHSANISRGILPNEKLLPSMTSIEQVKMLMKRTGIPVTKEKLRAINEVLNKTEYSIDFDFLGMMSDFNKGYEETGKLNFSRQNILDIMGYEKVDKEHDNIDAIATKEAHNKALEEEYDNFSNFILELKEENPNPETIKMHMDYFVAKNGRMNNDQTIGNVIQQKHFVRQIMSFSETAKLDLDNDVSMMSYMRAILQNLGSKIENIDAETPLELLHLIQDEMAKVQDLRTEKELSEWAAGHEGLMSLRTLMEIREIRPLLDTLYSKSASVGDITQAKLKLRRHRTKVTLEVDGITNGVGISVLQYGAGKMADFMKYANRVGIYLKGQSQKSYADFKELDGYQGVSKLVLDGTKGLTSLITDAKSDKSISHIIDTFGLKQFGRALAKYPLMTYFYGSGMFATSRLVANDMYDKMLADIKTPKDMKNFISIMRDAGITGIPVSQSKNKKTGEWVPNMRTAIPLEKYFFDNKGQINWKNFREFSFENPTIGKYKKPYKLWLPSYDVNAEYDAGFKVNKEGKIVNKPQTYKDAIVGHFAHKIGKRYYKAIDTEYGHFGKNTEMLNKSTFILGEINEIMMRDDNFNDALLAMTPKQRKAILKKINPIVGTFGSEKGEGALISKILSEKFNYAFDEKGNIKVDDNGIALKEDFDSDRKAVTRNSNTGKESSISINKVGDKAALKTGAPSIIHHLDAAIMAKALLRAAKILQDKGMKVKATQIYDAIVTQHDQSTVFAQAYNEAMVDIMMDYSVNASVTQALMDKYLFLTQYENGLGQMLDDMNVELGSNTSKMLNEMLTQSRDASDSTGYLDRVAGAEDARPENVVLPFAQQLKKMIAWTNTTELTKVKQFAQIQHVNQVSDGSRASVHEITTPLVYTPKLIKVGDKTPTEYGDYEEIKLKKAGKEAQTINNSVLEVFNIFKFPKPGKTAVAKAKFDNRIKELRQLAEKLMEAQDKGEIESAAKMLNSIMSESLAGFRDKSFSRPYQVSHNGGDSYGTRYDKAEYYVNQKAWLTVDQATRFYQGKMTDNDMKILESVIEEQISDSLNETQGTPAYQKKTAQQEDNVAPEYYERSLENSVIEITPENDVFYAYGKDGEKILTEVEQETGNEFENPVELEDTNLRHAMKELGITKPFATLKAMSKYFGNIEFDFTTSSIINKGGKIIGFETEDGSWDSGRGLLRIRNALAPFKKQATLVHEFGHVITADYIEKNPNSPELKALVKWLSKNGQELEQVIKDHDGLSKRDKALFLNRMAYITSKSNRTDMIAEFIAIAAAEPTFRQIFAVGAFQLDDKKNTPTMVKMISKLFSMVMGKAHDFTLALMKQDKSKNSLLDNSGEIYSEGYARMMIALNKSLAKDVQRKNVKKTASRKYNAPSDAVPNTSESHVENVDFSDLDDGVYKREAKLYGFRDADDKYWMNYKMLTKNNIPLSAHKDMMIRTYILSGALWGAAIDVPLNTVDNRVKMGVHKMWTHDWTKGKRESVHDYWVYEQYKDNPVLEPMLSRIKTISETTFAKEMYTAFFNVPKNVRGLYNDFMTSKQEIELTYTREKAKEFNDMKELFRKHNVSKEQEQAIFDIMFSAGAFRFFDKGTNEAMFEDFMAGRLDLEAWSSGYSSAFMMEARTSEEFELMSKYLEGTADALATGVHNSYELSNGKQLTDILYSEDKAIAEEHKLAVEEMFDNAVTAQAMLKTNAQDTFKTIPFVVAKHVGERAIAAHNVSTVLFEADVSTVEDTYGNQEYIEVQPETRAFHRLGYYKEQFEKSLESRFVVRGSKEHNMAKLEKDGWTVAKETKGGYFIVRENLRPKFNKGIIEQEGDQARGTEIEGIGEKIGAFRKSIPSGTSFAKAQDMLIEHIRVEYGETVMPVYSTETRNQGAGAIMSFRYIMSRKDKQDILGLNTQDVAKTLADTFATSERKAAARIHNQNAREALVASFHPDITRRSWANQSLTATLDAYASRSKIDDNPDMKAIDETIGQYIETVRKEKPIMLGEMPGFNLYDMIKSYERYHKVSKKDSVMNDYDYIGNDVPIPPQFKNEGANYVRKGIGHETIGYHDVMLSSEDSRYLRKLEHWLHGITSTWKGTVVSKNPVTQTYNILSNVYILRTLGVPFKDIYTAFTTINEDVTRLELAKDKISALRKRAMKYPEGSPERIKYMNRLHNYEKKFMDSDLFEMVAGGFMTSLTDEINSDIDKENDVFMRDVKEFFSWTTPEEHDKIVKKLMDRRSGVTDVESESATEMAYFVTDKIFELLQKTGTTLDDLANQTDEESHKTLKAFTKSMTRYMESVVENGEATPQTLFKELFMMEGSLTGSSANRFMQQMDYATKKAAFDHIWKEEQYKAKMKKRYETAGKEVPYEYRNPLTREEVEFESRTYTVDYRRTLPPFLSFLSKTMIWPFVTYSVGIQMALFNLAVRHPVRAIVHAVGYSHIGLENAVTFESLLSPDHLSHQISSGSTGIDFAIPEYLRMMYK